MKKFYCQECGEEFNPETCETVEENGALVIMCINGCSSIQILLPIPEE